MEYQEGNQKSVFSSLYREKRNVPLQRIIPNLYQPLFLLKSLILFPEISYDYLRMRFSHIIAMNQYHHIQTFRILYLFHEVKVNQA